MTDEEPSKIFAEDREFFHRSSLHNELKYLSTTDGSLQGMWVSCRVTGDTIEQTLIKCLLMMATERKKLLEAEIDRLWRKSPEFIVPLYARVELGQDKGGCKGAEDVSV